MCPAKKTYGGRGQEWHPDFIEYMSFIANHPIYAGMPDTHTDEGLIQWEAPSNRTSGKFRDTHQKRLDWWRKKAVEVGISTDSLHWISRVAKLIHPTKQKPCKKCGSWMEIRYAYPSDRLLDRVRKLTYMPVTFELSPIESILDLISRIYNEAGSRIFADIPQLLRTGKIQPPQLPDKLEAWLNWIDREYIPLEPNTLSPGAMANPPDRFDGFHSFNRCCRGEADKGRHKTNLASYTTDRRVFEHWNEGNWIAADRLMGKVRTKFFNEPCLNGHSGPCAADHIGPLSLGFTHRPEFQLLCSACNSAKNNRMTLRDVEHLRRTEATGSSVISWYGSALWDALKEQIHTEETALRLSKILRDNRHNAILLLAKIMEAGYLTFLLQYLELHHADRSVEFTNLHIERYIVKYDEIILQPRTNKYALEQKTRRCRIGFQSLRDYTVKQSRNALLVTNPHIVSQIDYILHLLAGTPLEFLELDKSLSEVLGNVDDINADSTLRSILAQIPSQQPALYEIVRDEVQVVMNLIASEFLNMWNDPRYVRVEGYLSD